MKEQITDIVKEHQIELIKGLVTSVFIARVDNLIATEVERRVQEMLPYHEIKETVLRQVNKRYDVTGEREVFAIDCAITECRSRLTENKQEGGEG